MIFSRFLPTARRHAQGALVILAALATFGASAQEKWWGRWDADFDEEKKPWKEIEEKIPSYPKPENLISFEATKRGGHRYFIDAQSLSLGEDGVTRYILVIKAAGGATNVTFEGIRCDMRQQKLYAVGNASGGWSRARDPRWRRIGGQEESRHGTLHDEYFCSDKHAPTPPKQVIQMLKYGSTRFGGPSLE